MKRSYGCICAAAVHRSIWQKIRSLKYNVVKDQFTFLVSYRKKRHMHIFYLFMKGKSLFVAPAFLEAKSEQTYWIKEMNYSTLNFLTKDFLQKAP